MSLVYCPKISYKMIVTTAKAGVRFESAWIPVCAGMTKRYHAKLDKKCLYHYHRDTTLETSSYQHELLTWVLL